MDTHVASDGSPVAAYAALPAEPELGVVRHHAAGRVTVLDLGCGAGRIADPLALEGHRVVAVDESPDMLRQVKYAEVVHSPVEQLRLDRTFDLVLLLSHLVNTSEAPGLLAAAARHLSVGGLLLAQRLPPGRVWQPGVAQLGPVKVALENVVVDGLRIRATSVYELDGQSWRQRWELWDRTDAEVEALVVSAGLRLVSVQGPWITATG